MFEYIYVQMHSYFVYCCFFFLFNSNASMLLSVTDLFAFSGEVVPFYFYFLFFFKHLLGKYVRKAKTGLNGNYISEDPSLSP